MDSSQEFGGTAEECQSSESGWTMYIGSPVEADQEDDDEIGPNGYQGYGEIDDFAAGNGKADNFDANSDDSMASDASSGPSHPEQLWEIRKNSGLGINFKGNEAKVVEGKQHFCSYKSKKLGAKKKKNEVKDEAEVVAGKGVKYHLTQGSNKVRKNLGWGKEKN